MLSYPIAHLFDLRGRGLVIAIDVLTDHPAGHMRDIELIAPDGRVHRVCARKQLELRRVPTPMETDAYLLVGWRSADMAAGTVLRFV